MVEILCNFLFADNCIFISHTFEEIQKMVDRYAAAVYTFGLTISIKKTEVLFQPKPAQEHTQDSNVMTEPLKWVLSFKYLVSSVNFNSLMMKSMPEYLSCKCFWETFPSFVG